MFLSVINSTSCEAHGSYIHNKMPVKFVQQYMQYIIVSTKGFVVDYEVEIGQPCFLIPTSILSDRCIND